MAMDEASTRTRSLELLEKGAVSHSYFLVTRFRWTRGEFSNEEFIYRLEHPEAFRHEVAPEWIFLRGRGWRTVVTIPVKEGLL